MLEQLSPRQAAAIMLQVPDSGDPWLDKMIATAVRSKVETQAMLALMLHNTLSELVAIHNGRNQGSPWSEADVAAYARLQADAMLAGQAQLDF